MQDKKKCYANSRCYMIFFVDADFLFCFWTTIFIISSFDFTIIFLAYSFFVGFWKCYKMSDNYNFFIHIDCYFLPQSILRARLTRYALRWWLTHGVFLWLFEQILIHKSKLRFRFGFVIEIDQKEWCMISIKKEDTSFICL